MLKNTFWGFVIVALLIVGSVWSLKDFSDPETGINLGIDLRGGTELVYEIDLDLINPESRATILEDVKAVIGNRFDAFGLKEISIATAGRDRLIIQLPGFDNAELQQMKQQIERSGELSFHLRSTDQSEATLDAIEAEWRDYEARLKAFNVQGVGTAPTLPTRRVVRPKDDSVSTAARIAVEWDEDGMVSGRWLQSASFGRDEYSNPAIAFSFSGIGAQKFGELTGNNVGQQLSIVLDGTMIQQAEIQSRITNQGRITGQFEQEYVNGIVTLLRAGSLPARPMLANEQTIGALLGRDSVDRGMKAMLTGFTIVVIFMLIYYMAAGVVANIALFLNMLFLLAAMQIFRNTLTFPGMAGLLLTVGMAVDANILIFARIREEKARGRGLAQAVQAGYQRAFWTIFDANVTTLITAYILFKFGSGAVKGFAVVLSIGIVASFFTSIYVSRLILTILIRNGWVKELRMMAILTNTKIDFMKRAKTFATLSAIVVICGLLLLGIRGRNSLGIDFTGGARLITSLSQSTSESDIREIVANITDDSGEKIFADVQVQRLGGTEEGSTSFSIRTRHMELNTSQPRTAEELQPGAVDSASPTSSTDQFRLLVADALRERSLLAPDGITDVVLTEDPGLFRAKINVIAPTTVTTSNLQSFLTEEGFPATKVDNRVQIAALPEGRALYAFDVEATPTEELQIFGLEEALSAVWKGGVNASEITLSTPFPEVNSIGGRVAADMQGKVFVSMMIAFFAIVFYISLRFRFQFGLAAIVALVHDICFVLGALALGDLIFGDWLTLKINLPVVAALLTTVGYSLNDTIVIFDRIRENLAGKKRDVDYTDIVNTSINQTLNRTVLTSATTFVVVSVLLLFGGEGLTAFSYALVLGVLVGTYSSIFVASPALIYFHKRSVARREEMLAEFATAK